MLKFSLGNNKLTKGQAIFDLPAGHSCPFAKQCLSKVSRTSGRIVDGPDTVFRCYAASLEVAFPNVNKAHWNNFDLIKGKSKAEMIRLIIRDMPDTLRYRIHSSGDFFSLDYFDAWLAVARKFPERVFYAYTKAIPFWIKRLNDIPPNFRLVASYGGTHDDLINKHSLKAARVVFSEAEAKSFNLEIDHDDSHAWQGEKDFALLIHGVQPKGTFAAEAWQKVKQAGGGYGKESNHVKGKAITV